MDLTEKDQKICEIIREFILLNRLYFQRYSRCCKRNKSVDSIELSDKVHNLPQFIGNDNLDGLKMELCIIDKPPHLMKKLEFSDFLLIERINLIVKMISELKQIIDESFKG